LPVGDAAAPLRIKSVKSRERKKGTRFLTGSEQAGDTDRPTGGFADYSGRAGPDAAETLDMRMQYRAATAGHRKGRRMNDYTF